MSKSTQDTNLLDEMT